MPASVERPPLTLVALSRLRAHEQFEEPRVQELQHRIQRDRSVPVAIVADAATLVVLDGHHRLEALRRLGCKRAPVMLVDYQRPDIRVGAWRHGETAPTKDEVLLQAQAGKLFPPKTTRHFFPWRFQESPVPLADLQR